MSEAERLKQIENRIQYEGRQQSLAVEARLQYVCAAWFREGAQFAEPLYLAEGERRGFSLGRREGIYAVIKTLTEDVQRIRLLYPDKADGWITHLHEKFKDELTTLTSSGNPVGGGE